MMTRAVLVFVLLATSAEVALEGGRDAGIVEPALAAELSERGPERAAGFSWQRLVDAHLAIYAHVS